MYIWVILATFIVAIYSFNLSWRADMKELIVMPQAEAIIGKMVAQHKAALRYIEDNKPPENGQDIVSFFPGELDLEYDLKGYLPYGFINDRDESDFRTLVYCLDKTDPNLATEVSSCGGAVSCCSDPDSVAYMVTFGCVPRKWRSPRTNKPKAEFFKAMRNLATSSTEVGYAEFLNDEERNSVNNVYHSDMAIRTRGLDLVSIPQFIVDGALAQTDLSFSDVCGINNVNEDGETLDHGCDKCLVYISPVSF